MKSYDVNMSSEVASNTKAVLDQNNIPIEELLGSVTTYNNVEGSDSKSQQLRTSARVFKKMKLDSAVVIPVVSDTKKESIKEETKPEIKRSFRPTWSQEDKNLFFEALNEYGKDFEAIHSHITNKLRKKGLPDSVMKTKDQVRHFYYRTWHKISKHLKFSDDIKKIAQELYGLINYGELRKKIGSVSEKTCMKLNELIYRGTVAVRLKGKTVRIKTPMCRALRKLNQLDEKHDDLKLPTRVSVELVPKDMDSWLRVQGLSQNPRIKASLPLQKRLSTLLKFLNCKWKSISAAAYENTLISSNTVTSDCVPEKKVIEENKAILDPCLRLSPQLKTHIELPTINLSEYLTSHSICLNAFEERIGVKIPGEQLWVGKGGTKRGGTKRSRNESTSEKLLPTNHKQLSLPANTDNNENCLNDSDVPLNVNEVIDAAVNTILALQSQDLGDNKGEDKNNEEIKAEVCEDVKDVERKEQDIVNIRKGWTMCTCGTLSVGELYLMFGSNSSLILEYSWDQPEKLIPKMEIESCDIPSEANKEGTTSTSGNSADVSADANSTTEDGTSNKLDQGDSNLMGTLQRLLSIAKLHYRKNIVHCPCGHVCGVNKPNNVVRSKPVIVKSNKTAGAEKNMVEVPEKSDPNVNSEPSVVPSVVPIIIQSPIRQFSPMAVFRRPISPNIDSLRAQLDSIQRLKPRYCNRRGRRPRTKQVVVERRLPLLPNKSDSGRQIVQMNIISPEDMEPSPRTIAPKILNIDKTEHNITNSMNIVPTTNIGVNIEAVNGSLNCVTNEGAANFSAVTVEQNLANIDNSVNITISSNCILSTTDTISITDNAVTPSRVGSPTSISNLLELALAPQGDNMLNNRGLEHKDHTGIPSFVGLLSHDMTNTTPPTSPSRILKENDNHWLNSEVADFSLSSFLGHLESPMKATQSTTSAPSDDNHLSQDVDAQLQSLLTESSVDYMAKFADLAAQVVSDAKK